MKEDVTYFNKEDEVHKKEGENVADNKFTIRRTKIKGLESGKGNTKEGDIKRDPKHYDKHELEGPMSKVRVVSGR